MVSTPILLIIYNRADTTRKVFDVIRTIKPKYLFVGADGPRDGNIEDEAKCKAARDIIQVDWDCELHLKYSEKNLGCGKGPASAITWFFNHVEKGIIIEDDTIPSTHFFTYVSILLDRYKENTDIWAITSMHLDNRKYGNYSYYFSMLNRTLCAWATWRRTWKKYDYFLKNTTTEQLKESLKKYRISRKEMAYWCERLNEIHKDRLNESSWDIQFLICIWLNNGKGICPNINLATNIGFNQYGTHTKSDKSKGANVPTQNILPLSHPTNSTIIKVADHRFHKIYYQPYEYGLRGILRIPHHLNKRIKHLIGHKGSWLKIIHLPK